MLIKKHREELLQSAISPEIIELNFKSLSEYEPLSYLLYGLHSKERRNDGRLRSRWLKQLKHTYSGGWWASGVDVLDGEDSLWGIFKPDKPKKEQGEDKWRKYEAPRKVATEIFALKIPYKTAILIARRNGVSLGASVQEHPVTGEALGFWAWAIATPQVRLLVTEGVKKAASLLTAGNCAIGASGIWGGRRQPKDEWGNKTGAPYLIPQLEIFATKDRQISFCFDNDTKPQTKQAVRAATCLTAKLLKLQGASCDVIRWDTVKDAPKGADDLIAELGLETFEQCLKKAIAVAEYELEDLTDLTSSVNLTVDSPYLGNPYLDPKAQIIGLKSAKGTGKTYLLEELGREAQRKGQRILVLTHRIQLAKTICDRLGIDHVDDFRTSATKGALGFGLCIDSLRRHSKSRFNPQEWEGGLVILDEIEQVLWHTVNSKTCQANRVEILENLQKVLQVVLSTGGRVILSDADLSPIGLKFIQQLAGFEGKTHIVENIHNPIKGKRKALVYKSPKALIAKAEQELLAGKKIFISTGSQKASSTWSSTNLETALGTVIDPSKILRIDAESIKDPDHPAFCVIDNLNAVIARYDCVIASPTIETGVSIDLKDHFAGVYAISYGVQTVDAFCQSVERVRDHVDRHIFVSPRGLNFVANGETGIKQILRTTHSLTQLNINCLNEAGLEGITLSNIDFNYQQASLIYWAKRACVVNSGMKEYGRSIIDKLQREGYEIVDGESIDPKREQAIGEEIKEIKTIAYEEENIAISEAEDVTDKELKQLNEKKTMTKEERYRFRKGKLTRLYQIEVTPELIARDDNKWYSKLRLHYYLTVGREYLVKRENNTLQGLLKEYKTAESAQYGLFKPDASKKLIFTKIRSLELLDIAQFLDPEQEFTDKSLEKFIENCRFNSLAIWQIFRIQVKEKSSAVTIAQSLLKQIGLKLTYKGRPVRGDDRPRTYKMEVLDPDGRNEVFTHWLDRDKAAYGELSTRPPIAI